MTFGQPAGVGGAQAPVPTRRVALVIWTALLAGVAAFAVVATFVGPAFRKGSPAAPGLPEVLGWVALGLSVLMLLLSRIVPRRVKAAPGVSPDATAVARTIVASALNEGAALFAIIVWLIGGEALALVPLAVSAAGLLLAFPSAARWRQLGGAAPEAPPRRLVR